MATALTLHVDGMSCAGCENNIRFALSSLAGINHVHADHKAARVEVVCELDRIDETAVRAALEEMGYHVGDER